MKTIWIILIFIFFTCGPFYFILGAGIEKAEKKGYGCCVVGLVVLFWIVLTIAGLVNMCKSCANSGPSIDYYESPR